MRCFNVLMLLVLATRSSGCTVGCEVSSWSTWSEPFGFGSVERSRVITQQPNKKCGRPCPDLYEVDNRGVTVTVDDTVAQLCEGFLRDDGCERDILLILDGSGSVKSDRFEQMKSDIVELLRLLCPSPPFDNNTPHRIAAIVYSNNAVEQFDFDDYVNSETIYDEIEDFDYPDGSTYTNRAFDLAISMFTSDKGARIDDPSVKKEIVIFTDGRATVPTLARASALNAQEVADVYGFLIGTFTPDGEAELQSYVSEPLSKYLYVAESFSELTSIANLSSTKLGDRNCSSYN